MKRRALWKDFLMEIKKTLNRFFSIFLIVALGVAFFAGLRATNPDMRLTADQYYDDTNLMDIRVLSTLGLTNVDVAAIAEIEGVAEVNPAYSTHVVYNAGGNEIVLEVMSLTDQLNQVTLSEGRLPESKDEVMVDANFVTSTGMDIGDVIQISSGTEKELSEILNQEEFTIVGIGTSPYYLSFQRGNSEIGNGEVNSFIVVIPDVFNMEVYTTVYASVEGAEDLTVYTEEYDSRVETVVERIEAIADTNCQRRYDDLYKEANSEIVKAQQELDNQKAQTEKEINTNLNNLQYAGLPEEKLQASIQQLEEVRAEADKKFSEAQAEIDAAITELAKIEKPKWYILGRGSIEAYVEFEQNADRIGAIGQVFPAVFFLVAALISLTTMTRMVEEQRIQIGTLKALGYSKKAIAMKYLLYALLATLSGSLFGAAVGLKVLPTIIITAYKIMYMGLPSPVTPFNLYHAALATVLAVLTVGIATYFACYKELMAKPANLMRPQAPKNGKRVLLERIPFLWNRLNFTWKATIRNLLRYKKRFFMTIFGIGGCMALLLVGFGLKDSIFVIYSRQFSEIMLYDASMSVDTEATDGQLEALEEELRKINQISFATKVRDNSVDISSNGVTKGITMYVPSDVGEFEKIFIFRSRSSHEKYVLSDDGVILTEQVAKKLRVDVGDSITIKEGDKVAEVRITAITENYLTHYVYMTPILYENLFGKVEYNEYFLLMPEVNDDTELQVGNRLLNMQGTTGVFYVSYFQKMLSNILVSLNIVVYVLIIAAGALAFVVLYNLNNININERRRELATIKVLGFYNKEMAAYVYRENIVLTIIGIICGIAFGIILHRFVIITVEVDMVMFGRNIDASSFIYSALLTLVFSAFVNYVMYFKLKKIDMVESLKSVE